MSNCIICGGEKNKIVFEEFGVNILKCLNCGHFFSSFNQRDDYDGYFGYEPIKEDGHFWWNEAHQKMYDRFCHYFIIKKKGRLLDVGCGLGYFIKQVSKYNSWEVFGCDVSRPAIEYARGKLNLTKVIGGQIDELNFQPNSFQIITLWDVIEHINNPDSFLKNIFSLLSEDGFLFIHTPNAKVQIFKAKLKKLLMGMKPTLPYLEARDHLHLYSAKTIFQILKRNGFNKINFIHLPPIQSVSGSRSFFLRLLKNFWYYFSVLIFKMTFKRINFDNLFVVAKK